MPVTPAIFISYRRDDTLSATGRLADALEQCFGGDEVFRDLSAIRPGQDFRIALQQALGGAEVVLVVIGPRWFGTPGGGAPRRLDDPADYVRIEIETALAADVPIIPVLVERAQMPAADDLPEPLRPLAYKQAHQISDERWRYDTDQLVAMLAGHGLVARRSSQPSSSGDIGRRIAAAVTRLPRDFLHLLYEPRRFLTMRGSGRFDDVLRAVVFLVVGQLLGAALILQEWPTRSPVAAFMISGAVLMLLLALVLSMPMYLAWRVAGAPREYQRVLAILLYQCAFTGLALSLAVFVMLLGINMIVPADVDRLAAAVDLEHASMVLAALDAAPFKQPWIVASQLVLVIAVALLTWMVGAWRAYGSALGRSGVRSLAAFVVFIALLSLPLALVIWSASLVR